MRKLQLLFVALLLASASQAQTPQRVVVEHFTNTRCSICASRNPAFYANLENHPEVIHLAIHPSSPYPQCLFNQYNVSGNDGRTNYYGIYGSTPKFVIQGVVLASSSQSGDPAIFDPYLGQTTAAEITLSHMITGAYVQLSITLKATADNTLGSLRLFAALSEDQVQYAAPNGEGNHYDVFREAYTQVDGESVDFPANAGDSIIITKTLLLDGAWNLNDISSTVILQDASTRAVIQAEQLNLSNTPLGISKLETQDRMFPNPASSSLHVDINNLGKKNNLQLLDALGRLVQEETLVATGIQSIDISKIPQGIYYARLIQDGKSQWTKKFVVIN